MIAIWLTIKAVIATLSNFAAFLAVGAIIGASASVLRPFLGIIGNALMGAILVGAVVLAGWAGDDSNQIAKLKAENERLERKTVELRLTSEALLDTLDKLGEAAQHNEKVMQSLRDKLDAVPDNPDCVIGKDIVDELNNIR